MSERTVFNLRQWVDSTLAAQTKPYPASRFAYQVDLREFEDGGFAMIFTPTDRAALNHSEARDDE